MKPFGSISDFPRKISRKNQPRNIFEGKANTHSAQNLWTKPVPNATIKLLQGVDTLFPRCGVEPQVCKSNWISFILFGVKEQKMLET